MFKNYSDIVEVSDLCTMLNISKKTAYRLLKDNLIPFKKIGKIYKIPKIAVIQYITNDNTSLTKGAH